MAFYARIQKDPLALASALRSAVWAVDKDQPISPLMTADQEIGESQSERRFRTLLLSVFAGLGLALAAVGIYGVISYAMAQRTHEIGVRIALGAQAGDVLKLVIGEGMRLALLGVLIGLAAAYALARVLASFLYGVSEHDPITFAGVAVLLMAVAFAACYFPARRAMRVDPMVALRYE